MARIGGVENVAVDNLGGHKAFLLIVDVLDWTCRLSFWEAPTLPLAGSERDPSPGATGTAPLRAFSALASTTKTLAAISKSLCLTHGAHRIVESATFSFLFGVTSQWASGCS